MTKLYKIRQLTTNNATGNAYGITIPQELNNDFSGTSFFIYRGGSIAQTLEIDMIDKVNAIFKQMSVDIPSEYYPQIQQHKVEIRQHITFSLHNLKHSIVLESGCKEGVVDEKRKDIMS